MLFFTLVYTVQTDCKWAIDFMSCNFCNWREDIVIVYDYKVLHKNYTNLYMKYTTHKATPNKFPVSRPGNGFLTQAGGRLFYIKPRLQDICTSWKWQ